MLTAGFIVLAAGIILLVIALATRPKEGKERFTDSIEEKKDSAPLAKEKTALENEEFLKNLLKN